MEEVFTYLNGWLFASLKSRLLFMVCTLELIHSGRTQLLVLQGTSWIGLLVSSCIFRFSKPQATKDKICAWQRLLYMYFVLPFSMISQKCASLVFSKGLCNDLNKTWGITRINSAKHNHWRVFQLAFWINRKQLFLLPSFNKLQFELKWFRLGDD